MSFLLTVFFFIWFLNLLGLTPLGVNVTGNIAVTFGLALLTFLITLAKKPLNGPSLILTFTLVLRLKKFFFYKTVLIKNLSKVTNKIII